MNKNKDAAAAQEQYEYDPAITQILETWINITQSSITLKTKKKKKKNQKKNCGEPNARKNAQSAHVAYCSLY